MVLVIDNYDSFTYNLVQYLGELKQKVVVYRNDKITIKKIEKLNPSHIVISPGPGRPIDAGISKDVIVHFAGKIPILGVCLGHQCIGEVFGGKVIRAKRLMHGKISSVYHKGEDIFKGLPSPFQATRYHSLIVAKEKFPKCLKVIAKTDRDEIMGLKHRKLALWGVQFHPESILTYDGKKLLENFLKMKKK